MKLKNDMWFQWLKYDFNELFNITFNIKPSDIKEDPKIIEERIQMFN